MTWIKSHKRTICLILAIIGGYILFFLIPKCSPVSVTEYSKPIPATKIDSIAKSYKQPEVKPNLIPSKKKVYKKKDTVLRKEAEKKDIILDVKIVDNHIIETVIDTSGRVSETILDVPIKLDDGLKELVIVPEGVQGKEKTKVGKFLQKVAKNGKKVLIVIGAGTVIVLVAVVAGG